MGMIGQEITGYLHLTGGTNHEIDYALPGNFVFSSMHDTAYE